MSGPRPSLRDQLQSALGSAYRIERELAGGGMSRVFVATEVALGRPVVVKVLHPELAAEVTTERFAREIQLVARLQQANIVPLLTAGHAGDLPFYTMPYVEGLSLRQRITEHGPLGISETIGILRDVARALAYAHDAGVMHRDVKPENVLISGGAAVVTDFGIAKAITVARTLPSGSTITQAGSGIGTPAYMAPEQAAGDPRIDHRADIYAFGCLAYELLTGHPPFRADAIHQLYAAHMTKAPTPVASLRHDIPAGLSSLVMRCLEKQPAERPQSARELLEALDNVATPTGPVVRQELSSRRGPFLVAAAAVVGAIAIAAYYTTHRTATAANAGPAAIAVIPFVNVGGDSAQNYLADGLSDELATAVGKIPGVRLASRSGSYRYRGRRDLDVRDVGKTLNVAYVIQGTVRPAGDELLISAQLNDAATGTELWSDNFPRTVKDVFRTQDDITADIRKALMSRLGGSANATPVAGRGPAQGTSDEKAYDLYLRGEYFLLHRQIDRAVTMFDGAIERDRDFARAYAGLAQALSLMPYFSSTPVAKVADRLRTAANTALVRDSSLAEPHTALAMLATQEWRWDDARVEFERAVAVDPNGVEAHFQFGRYWFYLNENARAIAEWNRTKELDPFSALAAAWTACLLSFQGKHAEALTEIRRAMEYDSAAAVVSQLAARVYLRAGQPARAVEIADRMPRIAPWLGMTAYVHAKAGDVPGARAMIRQMESVSPRPWLTEAAIAFGYLGVGDTANALVLLERSTDSHEIWPAFNRVTDPIYDPIRKSARWAALLKRVGLDKVPGAYR